MAEAPVRVVDHTAAFAAKVGKAAAKATYTLGNLYKNEVQRLMRTSPASGRLYRRLRTRRASRRKLALGQRRTGADYIWHQASAPGQPPAVDYGRLVNSVTVEVRPDHVLVGSSMAKVPLALEFGRLDGTIAPRPAWRPALSVLRGPEGTRQATYSMREALGQEGVK